MPELTSGQFQLVYNVLSLSIAAMLGSFAFFVMARGQLAPKFRPAMIMSALVVGIAGYHYWRIFNSWDAAYQLTEAGTYVATGKPFNDAYRYVDWLLTVPLLVAELVAVLALRKDVSGRMMTKLIIASTAMIALGYPGEIADGAAGRTVWGLLSTVPFVYIVYVLWNELGKAAADNSSHTKVLLRNTQLLLLGTWGFYPIAYMLPLFGVGGGAVGEVALQVGYSLADILAKCGYGLMIYHIARSKMEAEGIDESGVRVSSGSPVPA
ncbi:MAG TPA: bacteriorhodopsin-like [Myxococcales bacterium LLY-WYZ-16_1]|nr:bacteriorhodopsin-like [Myxococcales bacterium LLY-WYZ-16_1]